MSSKPTINVNARDLDVGSNATMSKDEAVEYVKKVILDAIDLCGRDATSAEARLMTEGSETDPVQKVRINVSFGKDVVAQSAHSRSIKKAIERAQNDLNRQVVKLSTKKTDGKRKDLRKSKQEMNAAAERAGNDFIDDMTL